MKSGNLFMKKIQMSEVRFSARFLQNSLLLLMQGLWFIPATGNADRETPQPVWEWKPDHAAERRFDGKRSLSFPEVNKLYNPAESFTVEVRLRVTRGTRLAGIVSDYSSSRNGSWYLSTGGASPYTRPRVVVTDESPYPEGYHTLNARSLLALNEWQTLLLISDSKQITLIQNGEVLSQKDLNAPPRVSEKSVFQIGGRGSNYFEGEIEYVKLYNEALSMNQFISGSNSLNNSSFEQGDTLADALMWHRMTRTPASVMEMETHWTLDDQTAWHGQRSLRGHGQTPLVLCEEVWDRLPSRSPWVFSVYLKADRSGVPCQLSVGAYWRLDEEKVSTTVELSTEWQRYELVVNSIPTLARRGSDPLQGPMNFVITPLQDATVWVDAVQWEPGQVSLSYQAEEPEQTSAPVLLFNPGNTQARPDNGQSSWTGSIPLRVHRQGEGHTPMQPVTAGVPFNRGVWNGEGPVTLTHANGESIPVQTEILTRWPYDQSVQSLGIFFTDTLTADWQNYTLTLGTGQQQAATDSEPPPNPAWKLEPPTAPGMLWSRILGTDGKPLFGPASLRAIGLDGTIYDSLLDPDAQWAYERSGPLHHTLRSTGRLLDRNGHAILAFTARVHVWRDIPGVKLELSAINSRNEGSVRLRSLYWHTQGLESVETVLFPDGKKGTGQTPAQVTSLYLPQDDRFILRVAEGAQNRITEGRDLLYLQGNTTNHKLLLHAAEGWQRHPSAVGLSEGEWLGYLWPAHPIRSLAFPRGLALTREFWLRETEKDTSRQELLAWDSEPIGIAAPEWWESTDIILPFAASDPERFPFIESKLGNDELLGRIGPRAIEQGRKYGVFDFGDNHGDGGWGNLESFSDWAAFLRGLRSGDEEALRIGFRASRHYRDIDMNQMSGACYIHNLNHIMGGTGFSHAWPEGVMVHYLLTGSKRCYELILLHENYLLQMDLERPVLLAGTRNLGRYLTNVVNVYQITGNPLLRDRFFTQLQQSKQALDSDVTNPDRSIFSNIGNWQNRRLVPFHAWYGITAMQKMASLTGNRELQKWINREIAATLNPELYQFDLEQLWPGITPQEGVPMIFADFARQRGSFFYPAMVAASQANQDPAMARLALEALYAWAVDGRGSDQIQTIVSSPPLTVVSPDEKEQNLVAAAADRMWQAAAPTLLNGDFSMAVDYWHHWRPYPGKSLSHHTNWHRRRHHVAALDSEVVRKGERSLRLRLSRAPSESTIHMDTHRFRLEQGPHTLTGWLRWDEGVDAPLIRVQVRDMNGSFTSADVQLRNQGSPRTSGTHALRIVSATVTAPDTEGWRKITLNLDARQPIVANLFFTTKLSPVLSTGHVWFSGFEF